MSTDGSWTFRINCGRVGKVLFHRTFGTCHVGLQLFADSLMWRPTTHSVSVSHDVQQLLTCALYMRWNNAFTTIQSKTQYKFAGKIPQHRNVLILYLFCALAKLINAAVTSYTQTQLAVYKFLHFSKMLVDLMFTPLVETFCFFK